MAYKNWTYDEFVSMLQKKWVFKIKYNNEFYIIKLEYILNCKTLDIQLFYGYNNSLDNAEIEGNKLKDIFDDVIIMGNNMLKFREKYVFKEETKAFEKYCNEG